jgi:hypothetical protein
MTWWLRFVHNQDVRVVASRVPLIPSSVTDQLAAEVGILRIEKDSKGLIKSTIPRRHMEFWPSRLDPQSQLDRFRANFRLSLWRAALIKSKLNDLESIWVYEDGGKSGRTMGRLHSITHNQEGRPPQIQADASSAPDVPPFGEPDITDDNILRAQGKYRWIGFVEWVERQFSEPGDSGALIYATSTQTAPCSCALNLSLSKECPWAWTSISENSDNEEAHYMLRRSVW